MPNNQQYIEEIIKVAIEGGWCSTWVSVNSSKYHHRYLLDPNFFRAIGKVKKWGDDTGCYFNMHYHGELMSYRIFEENSYQKNWHRFLDKIIEKDLDHAIEWLYNLIKE